MSAEEFNANFQGLRINSPYVIFDDADPLKHYKGVWENTELTVGGKTDRLNINDRFGNNLDCFSIKLVNGQVSISLCPTAIGGAVVIDRGRSGEWLQQAIQRLQDANARIEAFSTYADGRSREDGPIIERNTNRIAWLSTIKKVHDAAASAGQ